MLRNIRFYILLASGLLSLLIYFCVNAVFQDNSVQIAKYTQIYALTAVAFLYVTLIIGPLGFLWKQMPYKAQLNKSRRALGVSAFYFALLHSCFAFFGELGGFEGLAYLGDKFLFAIILSFIALVILYLLAITSFDVIIQKLTFKKWKILQRFVYLAGILILIHSLLLGSHFQKLSDIIPQIFYTALGVLIFLEALRFDSFLDRKFKNLPSFGLTTSVAIGCIFSFYIYSLLSTSDASPFSMHGSSHSQTTQSSGMGMDMTMSNMAQYPGMDGDKTKRFTTSFIQPEAIQPGQDTTLRFIVNDASSGKLVRYFKNVYEKPSHLIVVDSTLTYFAHIHPVPTEDGFTITTQFPKDGEYHLYLSYQPIGAIEQQTAFTVSVNQSGDPEVSRQKTDTNLTKKFGAYQIVMDSPQPLLSPTLSSGQQKLSFTIKDSSGKPVTTLKPYLGAFGHLVIINQKTYDYLHVHPASLITPKPNDSGGPQVTFMSLGMYGPIKPGNYRLFAEFNPDTILTVADYTVEVK